MNLDPQVADVRTAMASDEGAIFDRLVEIAEKVSPAIQNALRWNAPTFTLADNWHHWLFSINATKLGVTLTFHKGWLLDDPRHALQGTGKHMRMLRFKSCTDIDEGVIVGLIGEAVKHHTDL